MTDRGKWVEAEGDKPKVEPTRRYFAEIRASLKNGLDASRDLEAECERLREQLAESEAANDSFAVEATMAREQLDAADQLLASANTFLERSGESDGRGGQVIASNVLPAEIFGLAEAASKYESARAALGVGGSR